MSYMPVIKEAWVDVANKFNFSQPLKRIASGSITVEHYKAYLRQVFHHTRENPQLQALATVYFRGDQRRMVKKFLQHAISEIGHDQLALNDLKELGENVTQIPFEKPLPATSALLGYAFYQIQNINPIGYLGYLFHLEFTPTQNGAAYMDMLARIGVPRAAMAFIQDHSIIDVGHNKLMEIYVDELITSKDDLNEVIYAMEVTGKLYADMIQGAFEQVDNPQKWHVSYAEINASRKASAELKEAFASA